MPRRKRRVDRRSDPGTAFIPEPDGGPVVADEVVAETLGQEFVSSATSGEEVAPDDRDEQLSEELGGPFVETSAGEEFAMGRDPDEEEGEVEPLPRVLSEEEERAKPD